MKSIKWNSIAVSAFHMSCLALIQNAVIMATLRCELKAKNISVEHVRLCQMKENLNSNVALRE